jgi:hypothetical protein
VPEILAVGSVVPRDQHWYSPIGLECGNRILICGRFRRDNVVPIIDLWHNMDEQRVFFYSICFDDCRAVCAIVWDTVEPQFTYSSIYVLSIYVIFLNVLL